MNTTSKPDRNAGMVRRFVIVKPGGDLFAARQGRNTYETAKEAQDRVEALKSAQPPGHPNHKYVEGISVKEWYCYPVHFDPSHPVNENFVWTASFVGRQKGAIGAFQNFDGIVASGENEEEARLSLYATHQDIMHLKLTLVA